MKNFELGKVGTNLQGVTLYAVKFQGEDRSPSEGGVCCFSVVMLKTSL